MTSLDSYITLGRSGLRVSPLCLGTMTFGEDHGWGASVAASEDMLDRYLDSGGNFIDTANVYTGGHSEAILGDAFAARSGVRDRIVLSSKFFSNLEPGNPNGGGTGRKALLGALEQSLRRLRTDYLDIYWIHNWDARTPIEETMRTLDDLVTAGTIRYVGFSDLPAWVAARAQTLAELNRWSPAIALQLEYSLLERTSEGELLPMAQQLGMGVMPWGPLKSGYLSGKYTRGGTRARGGIVRGPTESEWQIIDVLESIAREANVSMATAALCWVRSQPGIASTLIGARSDTQLQENIDSLSFALSSDQLAKLREVSSPSLNFPAYINEQLAPKLAFGGMTIDGKAVPSFAIAADT